jgi:hypothetical protein
LLSTILTASIAGAGLIMAIYALVAGLRNKIFEKRLTLLSDKMKEFEESRKNITPEQSLEDFQHFRAKAVQIQTLKDFPTYLASGVKFVFTFYILTAFFSLFWLIDVVENQVAEILLILLFCFSTLGFFGVVWSAIKDIQELMKEEFEQLKKKQKEASDMSVIVET